MSTHSQPWPASGRWACAGLCILAWLGVLAPVASASPDPREPQAIVFSMAHDLSRTMTNSDSKRARVERVGRIVARHTDFEFMAKLALADAWAGTTVEQRARFVDAFRLLLLWSFADDLSTYATAELEFASAKTNASGNIATVRTRLKQAGQPDRRVDYRLRAAPDGWKMFDIVADGVSLILTYRRSFKHEVSTHGVDHVIGKLVERIDAL